MKQDKLPLAGLTALSLAGFLAMMTETLPAGLLPSISASLHISEANAGQLVTIYAVGSILAAIPVIAATKTWPRKRLFMTALAIFAIFNTLTAILPSYWMTLIARFAVGIGGGVVWGMLAGYSQRLVPPHMVGRAMSIALMGTPIALSFGIPVGTWLGNLLGWRIVFGIMSAFAVLLLIMVWRTLPDFPGIDSKSDITYRKVWTTPSVRPLLLVTLFWIGAHNGFYTYIAPFLSAHHVSHVDLSLLIFGIASVVSLIFVGMWIDAHLKLVAMGALGLFIITALLFVVTQGAVMTNILMALWGLSFGGAAGIIQAGLSRHVSLDALDLVMSLNTTMWNSAIALGGIFGGLLVQTGHITSFPWAVAILAFVALLLVSKHIATPKK